MKAPASLQARIIWLLSLSMLLLVFVSIFLMRQIASQNGAEQAARLAYAALDNADQAQTQSTSASLIYRELAPPATPRAASLVRRIEAELRALVQASDAPQRTVTLSRLPRQESGPRFALWLERQHGTGFVGVLLEPERERLFVMALIWLLVLGLCLWWIARKLTQMISAPLSQLALDAKALVAGQSIATLSDKAPSEVLKLSEALTAAATQQLKVSAERELMLVGISHDLRTPIARLRMALELQKDIAVAERDAMIADLSDMEATIASVLHSAREAEQEPKVELPIRIVLEDLLQRRASQWQFDCAAELAEGKLSLPWNSVRRVLGNLLDNAEQHGGEPRSMSLSAHEQDIVICVKNAPSAGAESSNSGAGLGLGLASRLAARFGARIQYQVSESDIAVTLRFSKI